MTDDEIRKMAVAAGFCSTYELWWEQSIPKFRKLIEAEREACAIVCETLRVTHGNGDPDGDECAAAIRMRSNQALPSSEKGLPKRVTYAKYLDKGPWSVVTHSHDMGGQTYIESGDFKHDARLKVMGDFSDVGQRELYAFAIAEVLNNALPSGVEGRPTVKECEVAKKKPAKPAKMPMPMKKGKGKC